MVYLGKDSRNTTDNMTVTHTVVYLTGRVKGLGHRTFTGNFFLMIKENKATQYCTAQQKRHAP
jgi:hypothetical protein